MILLEHNGKALFKSHGVPTPVGAIVRDHVALSQTLGTLPPRVVLKAQIAVGGRGKGGGIAFANSAAEAHDAAAALFGRSINGHSVDAVLVEERIEFERERYAGILIEHGEIRLMFARSGGVDIEDITAADPSNLVSIAVDPIEGPTVSQLQDCFARLGYAPEYMPAYERIGRALFAMAHTYDATMIEINPLAELPGRRLIALDARIAIDDSALDRQPVIAAMQPRPGAATRKHGSTFAGLKLRDNPQGGAIGLIGLGGGLNVTLMDWIADAGSAVGTLIDIDEAIGGGHAQQGFSAALEAFDRNPSIRSVLINIITCGYRLDEITAALLRAVGESERRTKPIVLHLRGNRMAKAQPLLEGAGWANSPSIAAAIEAVVAAAKA